MYRKILIPTDGSPISRKAVKHGIALAKQIGAKVVGFFSPEDYRVMLYSQFVPPVVVTEKDFQAQAKRMAEKQLGFVEKSAKGAGVNPMRVITCQASLPGRPSSMQPQERSAT